MREFFVNDKKGGRVGFAFRSVACSGESGRFAVEEETGLQNENRPLTGNENAPLLENIPFEIKAKSALLMCANTGEIIFEMNSDERRPIASITKIMTMLLVMEAIAQNKISLNDVVVVSEHAAGMGGSQVYLAPGEEFTVHDLLKAVAVHSANDASVALAEHVAGSEGVFVSMMNEKAKELGMINTNFLDCSGLTDEDITAQPGI